MKMQNSKIKRQKLKGLIFLGILIFPLTVFASLVPCGTVDDPNTPDINESQPCQLCHLFVLLDNVIDFFLFKIVLPVATLMLVVSGIMYMIAIFGEPEILPEGKKGGPKLLSQAKKTITSVFIGLFIIFAAFLIIGMFLKIIGLADWTENIYQNWWQNWIFEIRCP